MKFVWLQIAAALAVSVIAAWFSIVGLVAIFPGATIAVIAMGCALEAAKIVTANTVFRKWKTLNRWFRSYFITAVLILSAITSLGIFGYLSKAHIEHAATVGIVADSVALVDNQIAIVQQNVTSDRQVLQQMDDAVTKLLADTATVRRAVSLRATQHRERTRLTTELTEFNKQLLALQTQRIARGQTQRQTDIDVGPLKYVAQMLYGADSTANTDKAARFLITILISVFDPLALLLLVSARNERTSDTVSIPVLIKDVPAETPRPVVQPVAIVTPPSAVREEIGHARLDRQVRTT